MIYVNLRFKRGPGAYEIMMMCDKRAWIDVCNIGPIDRFMKLVKCPLVIITYLRLSNRSEHVPLAFYPNVSYKSRRYTKIKVDYQFIYLWSYLILR